MTTQGLRLFFLATAVGAVLILVFLILATALEGTGA